MTLSDRRFVLRMIPYGVHVVTTRDAHGVPAARTVHWVSQTSFDPVLVMVALPPQDAVYAAIRSSNRFALHMLGREDHAEALAFAAHPARLEGDTLSGRPFMDTLDGLPLLKNAVGVAECAVRAVIEFGDHHPFLAEVTAVHARLPPLDRPDEMILQLRDLGTTIFYGG